MKIASITGLKTSQELTVTKSISALVLAIDGLALSALTTEKISVYIERANGSNIILANKILFKDFILASTFGSAATQSDATYETIALCELAEDGGIQLGEKESIKIQLDDLVSAEVTYDLFGIEEPKTSQRLYQFELKTIASEEFSKKIDVAGFDLAVMTVSSTVSDILYRYVIRGEKQIVKYLPFELQTISRDLDPIQALNGTAILQGLTDRVTLPLVEPDNELFVDQIEVNKAQGEVVNFVVRSLKEIY